jgi:hypothetical protein
MAEAVQNVASVHNCVDEGPLSNVLIGGFAQNLTIQNLRICFKPDNLPSNFLSNILEGNCFGTNEGSVR